MSWGWYHAAAVVVVAAVAAAAADASSEAQEIYVSACAPEMMTCTETAMLPGEVEVSFPWWEWMVPADEEAEEVEVAPFHRSLENIDG